MISIANYHRELSKSPINENFVSQQISASKEDM